MALNNPALFNAVVAGVGGGCNERWLTSNNQNSYTVFAAAANAFATIVDGQIATIAGGPSIGQIDLMQSVVQGVMADRLITQVTIADYITIAQAIAAVWGKLGSFLDPSPIAATNKVAVDAADTTPDYLGAKLAAGTGIALTVLNPGANEMVGISSDQKVKVSATDTTANYLTDKISVTNLTKTILNPGANEILNLASNTPPPTAIGDLLYSADGANWSRLGIGTVAQRLTVVGGLPAWANVNNFSKFTTNNSPVAVWNFNSNLNDESGNGFNLSVASGPATPTYAEAFPGVIGFYCGASTILIGPNVANFRITGDVTLFAMIQYNAEGLTSPIVSCMASGEVGTDNVLYQITMPLPAAPTWFSEHGAGVNDSYTPSNTTTGFIHNLFWIAARRASNVIQFFINGRLKGAASAALTAPDGGSISRVYVNGNADGNAANAIIAGVKICASALTDQQIYDEYNNSMGKFFGTV